MNSLPPKASDELLAATLRRLHHLLQVTLIDEGFPLLETMDFSTPGFFGSRHRCGSGYWVEVTLELVDVEAEYGEDHE